MIWRALFLSLVVFASLLAPVQAQDGALTVAQNRETRSLFEVLFGSDNEEQAGSREQPQRQTAEPEPQAQPRRQPQPQPQPAPEPQPSAPAPAPEPQAASPSADASEDKAEDATRIAVFGDSLALDLARALERIYADDSDTVVLREGVGSSGFVRDDFFDWNAEIAEQVAADSFDVAVVIIGINDRQALNGAAPLSDAWKEAYSSRIQQVLETLTDAGKPVIWLELPPMARSGYSADMAQISSIHRRAVSNAGAEWVETYERFLGEDGAYSARGPDINGQVTTMRKDDGIHFSSAGADKLAFYVDQALSPYSGGGFGVAVSDPLAGTDAAEMLRPPFQGMGEMRMLDVAGSVQSIAAGAQRADDLILADRTPGDGGGFDLEEMVNAPAGRADAFGAGIESDQSAEPIPGPR